MKNQLSEQHIKNLPRQKVVGIHPFQDEIVYITETYSVVNIMESSLIDHSLTLYIQGVH